MDCPAALHGAWAGLAEFSRESFGLEPDELLRGATRAADVILTTLEPLLAETVEPDMEVAEELAELLFEYWTRASESIVL